MEIRDIQTSTLERLQSQAESLDRTEYQLKETRNSLAHGSRTLDGIESGAGQLKNMLTPNLHKGKGPHEQIDRTVIFFSFIWVFVKYFIYFISN